jgi:cytochrome c oxidase subunit 3
MSTQFHPYHLVDPSPWPYVASLSLLGLTSGSVMYMQGYKYGELLAFTSFVFVLLVMIVWWRDVIREGTYQGHHTSVVQKGLSLGMLLFITSEAMLFFSFFWAFFHSSLGPTVEVGAVWPPIGISALNPFEVPSLNTAILLTSGATVTWAHHAVINKSRSNAITALTWTVALGLIFTVWQGLEYIEAPFTIADSVYGSTFYIATGFHGVHVIVGTLFLGVCLYRLLDHQFTQNHHKGFEAAIWYWHFVDYVWIFLFLSIYWWGC